jgi:hypothetical protein
MTDLIFDIQVMGQRAPLGATRFHAGIDRVAVA